MNKAVRQQMPEPFSHIEISVNPMSVMGKPGSVGDSVGIMDTHFGEGTRGRLEYAEAEAKAVLKAIRAYRRKNAGASK